MIFGKTLQHILQNQDKFGKSLLISTLDELFQGNKELFRGLWLHDSDYTWQTHPVIRIDFSRLQVTTVEELKAGLIRYIRQIAQQFGVTSGEGPYYAQFEALILGLATEKQVAILIDEYDKPIIENLRSAYNQIEVVLSESHLRRLLYALSKGDLPQFFNILEVFFANIDYDLQLDYEKYDQTIFYLIFLLLGVQVTAEAKTNQGRIDAVIELATDIYLFEFKLNRSAAEALAQIKAGEYYQKYRLKHKTITLVGANFDSGKRKITDWQREVDQTSSASS